MPAALFIAMKCFMVWLKILFTLWLTQAPIEQFEIFGILHFPIGLCNDLVVFVNKSRMCTQVS